MIDLHVDLPAERGDELRAWLTSRGLDPSDYSAAFSVVGDEVVLRKFVLDENGQRQYDPEIDDVKTVDVVMPLGGAPAFLRELG